MSDKLLAKESTRSGLEIEIYHAAMIGDSPVMPIFLRDLSELMNQGFAQPFIPVSNRSKALYAIVGHDIVGEIIYDFQDDVSKTTWIAFSHVDKKFRRQGIFKILHEYLEKHAQRNESKRINSFVHVENTQALDSCRSVGRLPIFYKTEKKLG